MRMFKYIFGIFLLVGIVAFFTPLNAQDWYGAATYQISFPGGDTKDFTNETSFRGAGLDFRKAIDAYTTVGLFFGWNVFHERTGETIELETDNPGAITGVQDRYLNAFPLMLNAHRYFGGNGRARPYIGLNAGGFIMLQRFEIGILALQEDRWDWGIAPELGFVLPLQSDVLLLVNGKYNYAFTGKSVAGKDIHHSYWGLNIGFAWSRY